MKKKMKKIPGRRPGTDYALALSNPKIRKNIGPIEVLGKPPITAFCLILPLRKNAYSGGQNRTKTCCPPPEIRIFRILVQNKPNMRATNLDFQDFGAIVHYTLYTCIAYYTTVQRY